MPCIETRKCLECGIDFELKIIPSTFVEGSRQPKGKYCSQTCGNKHNGEHGLVHGHSPAKGHSPTYATWKDMLQRCNNPKHTKFYMYGEAGITVCERWLSFINFLADMGERPNRKTIDRIDGTKGYYKENCKWSTITEQQRNIKSNHWITYNGETKCLAEWAEIYKINAETVRGRIRDGWPVERIFDPPFKPNITYEVITELRRLRNDGETPYEQLGEKFRVSAITAWRICNDPEFHDIAEGEEYTRKETHRLEKLTRDVVAEIQRLREGEKLSYARLAKRFEIGYGTVRKICLGERR